MTPFSASESLLVDSRLAVPEQLALDAFVLSTGQELAEIALASYADVWSASFEMGLQAEMVFAALTDYAREYRDCAAEYSELKKLDVYDELQEYLVELKTLGVSICYATREMVSQQVPDSDASTKSVIVLVLYLVAFPLGQEPESFLIPGC